MRFHKLISVLLHPIVVPTIGVILYFLTVPTLFVKKQKLAILGLIFIATYFVPLLLLIVLKALNRIESYQVNTIKERKLPLAFMIVLFYLLGNSLYNIAQIRDIGILFYATSLGLMLIYILFLFKLKTSLHLISMGIALGFFLLMSTFYSVSFSLVIIVIIILSGLLGSSRLHLKAHTPTEVYLGFILGVIAPFLITFML
ncbi:MULTISPECIES: hypothetical protein [Tenacibaculum]|uniref:hypothetical protein n=1 Tax=Tenacibaculum TaxID=104267 RepID=UPI001F0B5E9C|nr:MULTISPECIES: hypothetical protein [Tenacibaculum]MCH3881674.1 hypothetical protein [Tenacibaculum aquimarinum]MCH3883435.1 hypothetical protein [Tenacibaculum aquimarinum]MDO6598741.1 hypothetical protein [Tenacibaculum sp. 1_MG-2023]